MQLRKCFYKNVNLFRSGCIAKHFVIKYKKNVFFEEGKNVGNFSIFIINTPDLRLPYRLRGEDCRNKHPIAEDLYDGQGTAAEGGGAGLR